jgi:pimeloyl-ACP methyl ester carboxylesterase
MPRVEVNDIQTYYEVHGEGFPVVMIQGLSANTSWWDPRWIQTLSERFKVVAFDNRGAGRTDISEKEYSVRLFADDTAALMDALGIPEAHVLGISMGGMIAQEFALNHPGKVEKLVLCSTYCGGERSVYPSDEVTQMLMSDKESLSVEEVARMTIPFIITEKFLKSNPGVEKFVLQQITRTPISPEAFARQLNAIMNFDSGDRLPYIKAPTLILHGKKDILVPPQNAPILNKAIPGSWLVYFENSAHVLLEQTEEVLAAILDFLTQS